MAAGLDLEGAAVIDLRAAPAALGGSATFSPDGSRVLTGSADGTARVWEAAGGTELAVLHGDGDAVLSAVFSPDGRNILTGSKDHSARVWDAADGTELAALHGHEGFVLSAVFSPDGSRVLTGSDDGTARIWEAPLSLVELVDRARARVLRSDVLNHDQKCAFYLESEGCP
ncbi:WD40 repeat domain-containing protein [Mangrovicoccus ximenensis]|uniref:WD40 repeat domain-containing protein n=1 Tax=Mangrovicoccus ximenensis TaxID=1911570 RepID=UPI0011AE63D7|nr:hypothetical protein [Mangrovicoccus ximenensis]